MPQANYRVPGGFEKLPRWFGQQAISELELTGYQVMTYVILLTAVDAKTGLVFMTDREIARRGGFGRTTAQRALRVLKAHTLVVQVGEPGRKGRATSYRVPAKPPEGLKIRPSTWAISAVIRPSRWATDRHRDVAFQEADSGEDFPDHFDAS